MDVGKFVIRLKITLIIILNVQLLNVGVVIFIFMGSMFIWKPTEGWGKPILRNFSKPVNIIK